MATDGGYDFGWVYVLANSALAGNPLKIGFTRGDVVERAFELSSTGLPQPFTILYAFFVRKPDVVELLLHRMLDSYRETKNREFFYCDFSTVLTAIETIAREHGVEIFVRVMSPDVQAALTAESEKAKKEAIDSAVRARDEALAAEKVTHIARIRALRFELTGLHIRARGLGLVTGEVALDSNELERLPSMFLSDVKAVRARYGERVESLKRKLATHEPGLAGGRNLKTCRACGNLLPSLPPFGAQVTCPFCQHTFEAWT